MLAEARWMRALPEDFSREEWLHSGTPKPRPGYRLPTKACWSCDVRGHKRGSRSAAIRTRWSAPAAVSRGRPRPPVPPAQSYGSPKRSWLAEGRPGRASTSSGSQRLLRPIRRPSRTPAGATASPAARPMIRRGGESLPPTPFSCFKAACKPGMGKGGRLQ